MMTVEYAVIAREVGDVSLVAVWEAGCETPSWEVIWRDWDGLRIEGYENINEAMYAFPELDLEFCVVANLRDAISHVCGDRPVSMGYLGA